MARNKELRQKIEKISEGILAQATDVVLSELFFGLSFLADAGYNPGKVWKAYYEADEILSEINYHSLKRAFLYARRKGLINFVEEEYLKPQITKEGKKRLRELFPHYRAKRTWDGKIYLVTYDIPEKMSGARDILRQVLKKLGAGPLQASVWITPYNPRGTLEEFIRKKHLSAYIIISDFGKHGTIGRWDLHTLMEQVYDLSNLNFRYGEFIQKYRNKEHPSPLKMVTEFFSILEDDPQIPRSLLPPDWGGDEAYELLKEKIGRGKIEEIMGPEEQNLT